MANAVKTKKVITSNYQSPTIEILESGNGIRLPLHNYEIPLKNVNKELLATLVDQHVKAMHNKIQDQIKRFEYLKNYKKVKIDKDILEFWSSASSNEYKLFYLLESNLIYTHLINNQLIPATAYESSFVECDIYKFLAGYEGIPFLDIKTKTKWSELGYKPKEKELSLYASRSRKLCKKKLDEKDDRDESELDENDYYQKKVTYHVYHRDQVELKK